MLLISMQCCFVFMFYEILAHFATRTNAKMFALLIFFLC